MAKNNKHAFSRFYTLINMVFDQSERAQGPNYIIKCNKTVWYHSATAYIYRTFNFAE